MRQSVIAILRCDSQLFSQPRKQILLIFLEYTFIFLDMALVNHSHHVVPQWRFFSATKNNMNQKVAWSKTCPRKPCLRRAQSMPSNLAERKNKRPANVNPFAQPMLKRHLSRQTTVNTTLRDRVSESRYPSHAKLFTMEDAREEVENRYMIPKRSYKRARREEESMLLFNIDENEDDLVGLSFVEE